MTCGVALFIEKDMSAGHKLYVGNLGRHVEARDLYEAFEKYGDVERVFMKEGYAFVHMVDERDAEDARHGMDNRFDKDIV